MLAAPQARHVGQLGDGGELLGLLGKAGCPLDFCGDLGHLRLWFKAQVPLWTEFFCGLR